MCFTLWVKSGGQSDSCTAEMRRKERFHAVLKLCKHCNQSCSCGGAPSTNTGVLNYTAVKHAVELCRSVLNFRRLPRSPHQPPPSWKMFHHHQRCAPSPRHQLRSSGLVGGEPEFCFRDQSQVFCRSLTRFSERLMWMAVEMV